MNSIDLISFLIFISVFVLIFTELSYVYTKKSFLDSLESQQKNKKNVLKTLAGKLSKQNNIFLAKIFNYSQVEKLLRRAGRPFGLNIAEFMVLHNLLGILAGIVSIILALLANNFFQGLLLGFFFFILMIYGPIFLLKVLITRRRQEFDHSFNTFIDMLALAVNAGMNFENALFSTTDKFHGVLREEFKIVQYEMNYGRSLDDSLNNMNKRIDSSDLKRFTTAIKQAKQLGTPLTNVLEIQSQLILTNRIQRAEELSRTASIKISIPLVFFIFPALLILYLAPAILQFIK